MNDSSVKLAKLIELKEEIELRDRLQLQYDKLLHEIIHDSVQAKTTDVKLLLERFIDVSTQLSGLRKLKEELKVEIRRIMGDRKILEIPGGPSAIRTERSRTDLNKKLLTAELGAKFLEKYIVRSKHEVFSVIPASGSLADVEELTGSDE